MKIENDKKTLLIIASSVAILIIINIVLASVILKKTTTVAAPQAATNDLSKSQAEHMENELSSMQSALSNLSNKLEQIALDISNLSSEMAKNGATDNSKSKAEEYLEAARKQKNNQDVAKILYLSALAHSENKAAILNEFVDWQIQLIDQDMKKNNEEEAQDRLIDLAQVCDVTISNGSVADMVIIPAIKNKLSSADEAIKKISENKLKEQKKQLAVLEAQLNSIKSYKDAEDLLNTLSSTYFDPALEDQKETIIARIITKESCLTTPDQELIFPDINEDTPWNAWLDNFIERLRSNSPTIKKFEDIGAAADFLDAASQCNVAGVAERLSLFSTVSRQINVTYWAEKVDEALKNENPDINEISSLLAESNDFTQNEYNTCLSRVISLNGYIAYKTNLDLEENVKQLRAIEQQIKSKEAYLQMIGMVQAQYFQFLLHLQGLNQKFPEQFSDGITQVSQTIDALDKLSSAYRNYVVVEGLQNDNSQRERFISWAKSQLAWAKDYDEKGEGIANQWTKTRRNKEAVENYKRAWNELMCIHPGDLQSADPALYQSYSELKTKIENHWKPSDDDLRNVKYKQVTDF